MQYRYFGKAMHMSAEFKRIQRDLRSRFPERYQDDVFAIRKTDDKGRVSTLDEVPIRVMSPRRRHEFSRERPKPYHF